MSSFGSFPTDGGYDLNETSTYPQRAEVDPGREYSYQGTQGTGTNDNGGFQRDPIGEGALRMGEYASSSTTLPSDATDTPAAGTTNEIDAALRADKKSDTGKAKSKYTKKRKAHSKGGSAPPAKQSKRKKKGSKPVRRSSRIAAMRKISYALTKGQSRSKGALKRDASPRTILNMEVDDSEQTVPQARSKSAGKSGTKTQQSGQEISSGKPKRKEGQRRKSKTGRTKSSKSKKVEKPAKSKPRRSRSAKLVKGNEASGSKPSAKSRSRSKKASAKRTKRGSKKLSDPNRKVKKVRGSRSKPRTSSKKDRKKSGLVPRKSVLKKSASTKTKKSRALSKPKVHLATEASLVY